jgi:hypothetical protein
MHKKHFKMGALTAWVLYLTAVTALWGLTLMIALTLAN